MLRDAFMFFEVATPGVPDISLALRVDHDDVDLARLGHVIDLQPYVDAIE